MSKTVPYQIIQFSISTQFKCKYGLIVNISISSYSVKSNNSVQHKNAVQFYSTHRQDPYQVLPGSNGNEGVLCIPQCCSITGTSPSDCLVSYSVHSLVFFTPLQRCSRCILQPQLTGQSFLGERLPKDEVTRSLIK